MHPKILTAMVDDIRAGKDGGTYLYPGKGRDTGAGRYVVGGLEPSLVLTGREAIASAGLTLSRLVKWIHGWSYDHAPTYDYGFWWDSATNLLYIDAVIVVSDKATAHRMAITNDEIAYYDLIAGEEIRVK